MRAKLKIDLNISETEFLKEEDILTLNKLSNRYDFPINRCNHSYSKYHVENNPGIFELMPDFEIGEWITDGKDIICWKGQHKSYGFLEGEYRYKISLSSIDDYPEQWQLADMDKVKQLLLAKAERDYKEGIKIISVYKSTGGAKYILSGKYKVLTEDNDIWVQDTINRVSVFDNGEWAEIIEPKLLGTSKNGLPIYEGKKYWWIDYEIFKDGDNTYQCSTMNQVDDYSYDIIFETEPEIQKYISKFAKLFSYDDIFTLWYNHGKFLNGSELMDMYYREAKKQLNF